MFTKLLNALLEESDSILGAAVISDDGIAIEQALAESCDSPFDFLAAELSILVKSASEAMQNTLEQPMTEFTLRTDDYVAHLKPFESQYFILLLVRADGLSGKSRYLLRRDFSQYRELLENE